MTGRNLADKIACRAVERLCGRAWWAVWFACFCLARNDFPAGLLGTWARCMPSVVLSQRCCLFRYLNTCTATHLLSATACSFMWTRAQLLISPPTRWLGASRWTICMQGKNKRIIRPIMPAHTGAPLPPHAILSSHRTKYRFHFIQKYIDFVMQIYISSVRRRNYYISSSG